MVEKELLEKQESIDLCLWKFLTYILNKYEGVLRRMHNCYSDKEKRTFLYNCAINTIDEFLEYKEKTLPPAISSEVIINTFKENIKLEEYADNFFSLQYALEAIFGRQVDLVCYDAITNPVFRRELDETKYKLYG